MIAQNSEASQPVSAAAIADYVKGRVRRGSLVPGQRVLEAEVMRETGGTRGRVREALQRLAAEDIVVIEQNRGASVKRLTRDEVDAIYRTREALEGLAALLFAERAGEDERERLAALQEALDVSEARHEPDAFARHNEAWHALIIAGARNDKAAAFLGRLRVPIFRMQFSMFYAHGNVLAAANADHRRITAALLARDGAAAERAMRAHVLAGLGQITRFDDEFFARDA